MKPRTAAVVAVSAVLLLLGALLLTQAVGAPPGPTAQRAPGQPAASMDSETGLPWVELGSLPPEAAETVVLIERGGPFPYEQDGQPFGNREGLLPDRPSGFYREYTVTTPGSDDRGARRIVTGDNQQFFYTDDHYATFSRIRR